MAAHVTKIIIIIKKDHIYSVIIHPYPSNYRKC